MHNTAICHCCNEEITEEERHSAWMDLVIEDEVQRVEICTSCCTLIDAAMVEYMEEVRR